MISGTALPKCLYCKLCNIVVISIEHQIQITKLLSSSMQTKVQMLKLFLTHFRSPPTTNDTAKHYSLISVIVNFYCNWLQKMCYGKGLLERHILYNSASWCPGVPVSRCPSVLVFQCPNRHAKNQKPGNLVPGHFWRKTWAFYIIEKIQTICYRLVFKL